MQYTTRMPLFAGGQRGSFEGLAGCAAIGQRRQRPRRRRAWHIQQPAGLHGDLPSDGRYDVQRWRRPERADQKAGDARAQRHQVLGREA